MSHVYIVFHQISYHFIILSKTSLHEVQYQLFILQFRYVKLRLLKTVPFWPCS